MDSIIDQTLAPISSLTDMYANLPKTGTNYPRLKGGQNQGLDQPGSISKEDVQSMQYERDKENVSPAATFISR